MADVLTLDPPTAIFDAASGGQSQHAVMNNSEGRVAVKVKCSDNALYRVKPVFGIIEPATALGIEISRNPGGAAKEDKLVIQYATISADEQDAQAPFRAPGSFSDIRLTITAS